MEYDGPLFDGRAPVELERACDEIRDDVAAQGWANVRTNLDQSLRNPTPYYETQIANDLRGDARVIHDRGIIYGPWLEGTGSRNRTTRFKGYASFRRAAQQLEGQVTAIAERTIERAISRLQ